MSNDADAVAVAVAVDAADAADDASYTLTGVEMCIESLEVHRKFITAMAAGNPKGDASTRATLAGITMCVDSLNALHANLEKPMLFDAHQRF